MESRKQVITRALIARGWTAERGAAIASKTWQTAVGPRQAFAYFSRSAINDPYSTLMGQYWSEGRNILEPHGVLIAKDANADEVLRCVEKFVTTANNVVAESYAMKVLKMISPA